MKRIIIFESACCTGWAFTYEADDDLQTMITRHANGFRDRVFSAAQFQRLRWLSSVSIYNNIEEVNLFNDDDNKKFSTIEELFEYFRDDGEGRHVDAAWIVNMLLSDPTDFDNWIPK